MEQILKATGNRIVRIIFEPSKVSIRIRIETPDGKEIEATVSNKELKAASKSW